MVTKLQGSERLVLLMGLAMASLLLLAAALHSQIYFVIPPSHYLIIHTALELAGILISFSVFVVNWESSKQNRNTVSLYIGTGFLAITGLDIMHTLSHEGMPDMLIPNTIIESLYFCLIARFWAAWVLWKSANLKTNRLDPHLDRSFLLLINLAVCLAAFVLVTLLENRLPPLFVAGQGSTWINNLLHFAVIGIYLMGTVDHLKLFRTTKDPSTLLIVAALVASLMSEITLIVFLAPGDLYIFVGHIYKVVAYYLIFKALTVTSVHRPYEQLKIAKDRLEQTVAILDARNRELDALDEVAFALGATIRPEQVLETAIDRVMKVMDARAGAIFLQDENNDDLKLVTWRGLTAGVIEDCTSHRLKLYPKAAAGEEEPGEDWAKGNPLTVKRLGGFQALIAPLRACACAPIVNKNHLLGLVVMVAKDGNQFSKKDTDLLTAIGYQFGLAIENARLYEQTDERLREKIQELQSAERRSRFLYEVGALFASNMELTQVLNLVAMKSVEIVGDCCEIYFLDEQGKTLRLEAIHCKEKMELAAIRGILRRHPIPVGEGLVGLTAQSGEPVLQPVVKRDEFIAELQKRTDTMEELALLKRKVPTSRLIAPMRAFGRTMGVMALYSTNPRQQLGDADLSLVEEMAGRTGVAIENRRLLQESQSQRRHLEAIISQMVDGVVVTDSAGRWLVVNASAERMLMERGKALIGHPIFQDGEGAVVISGERESVNERHSLVERALAGELITGEEVYGAGPKGESVLSASASPIRDETRTITGAVVVLRDVTAEKAVEKMKDEFVATTSHELRTPITAVMGYTDLLLRGIKGPLTPKQQEALEAISGASKRLLRLINDLLDMSRLEAGRQDVNLAPVRLAAVAEKALSDASMLAVPKHISILNSLKQNLPLVLADEEQLQRIIGNLLSNAIKFTDHGGKITLDAFVGDGKRKGHTRKGGSIPVDKGELVVTIKDTGIGIPPEYQDKIWDKFRQVDSSTRRLFGGTGLGLAITKRFVELHGGRVWVQSEGVPGKGSTFGFTLRVAEDKSE